MADRRIHTLIVAVLFMGIFPFGRCCAQVPVKRFLSVSPELCNCPHVSESYQDAPIALLVQWLKTYKDTVNGERRKKWVSAYKVIKIGKDSAKKFELNQRIILNGKFEPDRESHVLLHGKIGKDEKPAWREPIILSPAGFDYLTTLVAEDALSHDRIPHLLAYLGSPDKFTRIDVRDRLSKIPIGILFEYKLLFSASDLRKVIVDSEIPFDQFSFTYGHMLGECGDEKDKKFLSRVLAKQVGKYIPLKTEQTIAYFMLSGDKGVREFTTLVFSQEKPVFFELYTCMQAMLHAQKWDTKKRISRKTVIDVLHRCLDIQELSDLAIYNLIKLHNWKSMERVVKQFPAKGEYGKLTDRAVVRYLLAAIRMLKQEKRVDTSILKKAEKHLDRIRNKAPETVATVEKYFH